MLTKNLLRFKIQKDFLVPEFVKINCAEIIALVSNLTEIFSNSIGKTRAEISDETLLVLNDQNTEGSIGRGFEKLLFDRLEFSEGGASSAENRDLVFKKATEALSNGLCKNLEDYRNEVSKQFSFSTDPLFDDLPMYQKVSSFKTISTESLIHRYNCAQIQGHLLSCQRLKIIVPSALVAELRRLLKYIRFFNLVASVRNLDNGMCEIVIDGPLSLFFQTQKYGMGLAHFFPALLKTKKWEMNAEISAGPTAQKSLNLSDTCGIKSHYDHFDSYIPDEISLFQSQFEKKGGDWKITPGEDFLPLEGDSYCLPDFCFQNTKGKTVYLEIFHAWHSTPLVSRLKQLEKSTALGSQKLILAAAKTLLKDLKTKQATENSRYFKTFGILFREMPTVDQVLAILNAT